LKKRQIFHCRGIYAVFYLRLKTSCKEETYARSDDHGYEKVPAPGAAPLGGLERKMEKIPNTSRPAYKYTGRFCLGWSRVLKILTFQAGSTSSVGWCSGFLKSSCIP